MRLVADYGEVNKKTPTDSGSIPKHENTLGRIAKCQFKAKLNKRSEFRQVELAGAAHDLLAFIIPKRRAFC